MEFETIEHIDGHPYKLFVVSIGHRTHHFHKDLEIIQVLSGSIQIHIGSAVETYKKGDLLLINPYEIHSITNLTDAFGQANLLLIIQIASQAFEQNAIDLSQLHFDARRLNNESSWLSPLMVTLYKQSIDSALSSNYKRLGTLYQLIGMLLERLSYALSKHHLPKAKDEAFKRILTLIEYVETHYETPIKLETLADEMHISKYHLSHSVKQTLGINFQTYLNTVRMTKAIQLLYTTKMSVLEISERAGFSDQKYLNQMIQMHYHCSARVLRNRARTAALPMPAAPIGTVHLPFDINDAQFAMDLLLCTDN